MANNPATSALTSLRPVPKTPIRGAGKRKYLLVMPRLIQNPGDGYSFPLGIAYISSSLKAAGFEVVTLNLNHRDGDAADIIRNVVEEHGIHVVATGGLSFQYGTVKRVVEAAKRVNGDIVTIVGGGIVSGDPEPAMEALEYADFGVIGEGEETMCELCRTLERGGDLSEIDGLIYKNGNGLVATNPRKECEDLDSIPWPDYQGFDLDKYLASTSPGISGLNRHNTIFMLASRSCPYNCTFCFHTSGKKYRQRSLDKFFAELDYMVSQYDITFVCMADELFAQKIARVKEFCERIKRYGIGWWAQFRVDNITVELLNVLKGSGCQVMSFGLESADNRVLKSMRKHTTVEQIEHALKLVYDSAISLEGAFIFGDVAETVETAENTLKWWREHSQYRISLNLITVYPGSGLYKHACEKGIIQDRLKFLKDGCPQVNVSKMTDEQMGVLTRRLMEAPISLTKALAAVETAGTNYKTGRVAVTGRCVGCGQENRWDDIKLFATNFLSCTECGQKYTIPLGPVLRGNIEGNFAKLLDRYGKMAVWCVNFNTADLFKNSRVLQSENVFAVDISATKRQMDLYGKRVHAPEIINREGIPAVIVAIPAFFTQIASLIGENYKGVVDVIDICRLTDPDYAAQDRRINDCSRHAPP